MHRLRVLWLPLLLVALNALLGTILTILVFLLIPPILLILLLAALLKRLLTSVSGGRWFARAGPGVENAEPPAGRTTLSAELRQALARRYQPCLVLFPEDPDLGPPYRADELAHIAGADYHPRAAELFLEHVRFRQGRTQWLPDLPDTTPIDEIRARLGRPGERQTSLEIPWLHEGHPLRIFRHLFPFGRLIRPHWAIPVSKADCGCSRLAWERYLTILREDERRPSGERRYPRTLYARVLQGRELPEIGDGHPLADAVALQYWWFLFYNDAWNRHQGDWEGVTIFLHRDPHGAPGDYVPLGAAYACHDLGRWRRWRDLDRVDSDARPDDAGTHPLVYVARGSHASYFDYNESGYHPHMSRTLRLPFFGDYKIPSQFALETRSAIDWVADSQSGFGNGVMVLAEDLKVMPAEQMLRDLPALRADDDWWWLAYRGLWGTPEFLPSSGGSGPRGPKWQGVKWSNPFRWVMRECIADDLPYWLEMFATWEPAEDLLENSELFRPQAAPPKSATREVAD